MISLGLCPYKRSSCRAIHQFLLGYDVYNRPHPTARRHLVQRSWSSSTAVTSPARGLDVASPLIGLSEEQSEFYRLSKAFADRGVCRLWVCELMGDTYCIVTIGMKLTDSTYWCIYALYVELRPFASEWDRDAVFPLDAFRKLADLGFAGN